MIKNIQSIIGGYSNPYFIILIFIVLAALDVLGIGIIPLLIESSVTTNSESISQHWFDGLIPIFPGYSKTEVLSAMVIILFFVKSAVYIFSNYLKLLNE